VTPKKQIEKPIAYLLLLLVLLLMYQLARTAHGSSPSKHYLEPGSCLVEVRGVVSWPGVYSFAKSPTMQQLVQAAGGLSGGLTIGQTAETTRVPCLGKVTISRSGKDRTLIQVGQIDAFHKVTLGVKLDLNHETIEGLTAIPGIGIKTAMAIVRLRDRKGGFKSLEELAEVSGIGPSSIARIARYATLTRCNGLEGDGP